MVAAATKTAFERSGDEIAVNIDVPRRPARAAPLMDDDVVDLDPDAAGKKLVLNMVPPSRWSDPKTAPDWPVSRWYGRSGSRSN